MGLDVLWSDMLDFAVVLAEALTLIAVLEIAYRRFK